MQTKVTQSSNEKIEKIWRKPPENMYRLDVDAYCNPLENRCATGGIVRHSDGNTVIAFGGRHEQFDEVVDGELAAIKEGLIQAKSCGIRPLIIFLDSLTAVQTVTTTQEDLSYRGLIIHDISRLITEVGATDIRHFRRVANNVAHRLANFASFSSTSFCWSNEDIPSWVTDITKISDKQSNGPKFVRQIPKKWPERNSFNFQRRNPQQNTKSLVRGRCSVLESKSITCDSDSVRLSMIPQLT
ncbi:hypothetical protein DH2020_043072 [Rehmannia glutinosa]|uniref:RNase H type-1 domain-containing protein n=1 Tax=Rehmannia glutinosa TaxID=99300 RepID=A0ABR0UKN3_REHGL